jgi:hypothetical protein
MGEIWPLACSWLVVDVFLFALAPLGYYALALRHRASPVATCTASSVAGGGVRVPGVSARADVVRADPENVLDGLLTEPFKKETFGVDGLGLVGFGQSKGEGVIGLGNLYRDEDQGPLHVCAGSRDFDHNCVGFDVLKRAVRRQQHEARACLDRARREHPRLRAQIEVDFDVAADGSVGNRDSPSGMPLADSSVPEGDDQHCPALADLEQCLVRAVSRWKIGDETLRSSSLSYWYHLRY